MLTNAETFSAETFKHLPCSLNSKLKNNVRNNGEMAPHQTNLIKVDFA